MSERTLTLYDWVPKALREYVRDLRVPWALEEAGLLYRGLRRPRHGRPAFIQAHADPLAHLAAADQARRRR